MDSKAIVGICVVAGLVASSRVAKTYVWPRISRLDRATALNALIVPHMFRFVGMAFLMPGVVSPQMAPAFAIPAAYGDLCAALLAAVASIALVNRPSWALPVVWLFNLEGTADLLFAYYQGIVGVALPAGALGAAFYIPTVVVPPLLVLHALIFALLVRRHKDRTNRVATATTRDGDGVLEAWPGHD